MGASIAAAALAIVAAMKRQAAFLRGVSPMNCKMPELAAAFEAAGFRDVKTVLSSGNVVFSGSGTPQALRRKAEKAIEAHLGRSFMTLVRPIDELQSLLDEDPFARHRLPAAAKRVVTFLASEPSPPPRLPIERGEARILELRGFEAFVAYVPQPNQPVFMTLIEKTFGQDVTTRTWDTVRKVCAAAA
jgi:uncharacterized protein (DUF1697 family)